MSILQRGSISYRVLPIASCNNGSPVTTSVWTEIQFTSICRTEHLFVGFEPGVFYHYTICKALSTNSTLLTSLFVLVNTFNFIFGHKIRLYEVQGHCFVTQKDLNSY